MELSLAFVASSLHTSYPVTLRGADGYFRQIDNPRHISTSPTFKTVRMLQKTRTDERLEKILVVAQAGTDLAPDALKELRGLIWIGNTEPPRGIDSLWISSQVDPINVFYRVLDLFEHYNEWENDLRDMLLKRRPSKEVVAKIGEVTQRPFWYADATLHVLYMSDAPKLSKVSEKWRYQEKTGRYPNDVISTLVASGELDLINNHPHAWIFEVAGSQTYTLPFVSKTISLNGGVYGHIFIIQDEPGHAACDLAFAETVGNLIATYVQHSRNSGYSGKRYSEQLLRSCLAGDEVSQEERAELLAMLGWNDSSNFAVAVFDRCEASNGRQEAPQVQVDQLVHLFPGASVFSYDVYIVLVTETTTHGFEEFLEHVANACDELGWKAGVSNEFGNFLGIDTQYGQAQIALQKGSSHDPESRVYLFQDYTMDYICQRLDAGIDKHLLIHPDIERLIDHDRENGSELFQTLKTYLANERNVSQTAKALFLHRNSVIYRIDKINSIMKTSLDSADNRLFLELSIKLWESK